MERVLQVKDKFPCFHEGMLHRFFMPIFHCIKATYDSTKGKLQRFKIIHKHRHGLSSIPVGLNLRVKKSVNITVYSLFIIILVGFVETLLILIFILLYVSSMV